MTKINKKIKYYWQLEGGEYVPPQPAISEDHPLKTPHDTDGLPEHKIGQMNRSSSHIKPHHDD